MKPVGVVREAAVGQAQQAAVDDQHEHADAEQTRRPAACRRPSTKSKPWLNAQNDQPSTRFSSPLDDPAGHALRSMPRPPAAPRDTRRRISAAAAARVLEPCRRRCGPRNSQPSQPPTGDERHPAAASDRRPSARGLSSSAARAGLSVSELNAEITVETAIVRANWRKNWPVMPRDERARHEHRR